MNKVLFFIAALFLAAWNSVGAQIFETTHSFMNLGFSGQTEVSLHNNLPLDRTISGASLYVSLDFGERTLPSTPFPTDENELFVSFSLEGYKNGELMPDYFGSASHTLAISDMQPEAFLLRDLLPETFGVVSPGGFPDMVKVIVHNSNRSSFPALASVVRFRLNYQESYGVNCEDLAVEAIEAVTSNDLLNEIAFQWRLNEPFAGSYFELQVLRLFNEDNQYASDHGSVKTQVNWDDAGSYILKNPMVTTDGLYSQTFTITEGTGYYLWRVRAVSNYYEGGLANPRNYGSWSTAPAGDEVIDYSLENAQLWHDACLYFTDVQADRNYSYSRVFTEQGKNKELVTYANRLNQVRQTATFLPSENVSVVTQTVLDHTGRPALVTLPVPIEGKNLGYRSNFLTTPEGELYRAEHFDDQDNFQNPSAVSADGYYSYYEDNPDEPIASAQGFPYTRTVFYNDGSGRVKEQSGVGYTHRIHDGSQEAQRTTRYFYESATASELEALFGHEAPHFESVFKTITIDPNQVASVSFVNKDGQTIATGLSFSSEYQSSALEEIDGAQTENSKVRNVVTRSSQTNEGFISSKRIYIPHAQPLYIDYKVELYELEQLCISQDFDCNYELSIKVNRILEDNSVVALEVAQADLQLNDATIDDRSYKTASTVVELPGEGTYLIQKELVPRGLEMSVSANTSVINGQVMPLVSFFTNTLENVKTREELENFFLMIREMSEHLNAGTFLELSGTFPYTTIGSAWWEVYGDYADQFSLGLSYMDAEKKSISAMQLSTPCCKNMDIPVNWSPPFDCSIADRNNDGAIDMLDVPDFEGYMLDVLYDAIMNYFPDEEYSSEASKIEAFYKKFLPGWDSEYGMDPQVEIDEEGNVRIIQVPGVVNQMVYHMLTDKYISRPEQEVAVEQYNCEEIFDCWSAAVSQLYLMIAPSGDFDYSLGMQKGGSVSTAYIGEQEGNEDIYEKDHDTHFNTGLKGGWFFTRWLAKRKISKKMRKLKVNPNVDPDDSEAKDNMPAFHLVKGFLDCSGYKFAKILTPFDAVPLEDDRDASFTYTEENFDNPPVPLSFNYELPEDYFSSVTFTKEDHSKYFVPVENWGPEDVDTKEPYFPNIRNPYYAFKYFYYDMMGNPDFQVLESSVCFVDPNDCYPLDLDGFYRLQMVEGVTTRETKPCCYREEDNSQDFCYNDPNYYGPGQAKLVVREFAGVGRVKCPYTHEAWSYSQRLSFYQMIANYRVPEVEDPDIDSDESPVELPHFINPYRWYFNTYANDENMEDPFLPEHLWEQSAFKDDFEQIIPHEDIKQGDNEFIFVVKEMHDAQAQCLSECENRRGEFRRKLYDMLREHCYTIGGCRTNNPATWDIVPEEDVEMLVNAMVLHCQEQCDMNTFSLESIETRKLETPLTDMGPNGYEYKFMYGMGGMPNAAENGYADESAVIAESFIDGDRHYTRYKFNYNNQPSDFTLSWYQYTAHKQVLEWDFEVTLPSKCADVANEDADYPSAPGDNHFVPRDNYEVNPNTIPDTGSPTVNDPVIAPSVLLQRSAGPGFDENGDPE